MIGAMSSINKGLSSGLNGAAKLTGLRVLR